MNRIEQTFGVPRVLLPVIHPISHEAALGSIRVACGVGVRGIFLIDQGMPEDQTLRLVCEVRAEYPRLWIGLNLLSRRPADALRISLDACRGRVDGIWSDDARVDERVVDQPEAEEFVAARCDLRWSGLYFGGVAFKYRREVAPADLGRAAALAAPHVDVVCTSGPGTGQPAAVEKIVALRSDLGETALALASGVTADNVRDYLPHVHAFLVGTGIEERLGVLDARKIAALHEAIERGPA